MQSIKASVVVVGGGVAGMSAALSVARCGESVLLLEKQAELGGLLRAGLDFPVCGLFDSNARLLNSGLSKALVEAVAIPPVRRGKVYIWPCPPKTLLAWFTACMVAEEQLTVMTETIVDRVVEHGDRIVELRADGLSIRPEVVIDCTGDGAVIAASSAEKLIPDAEMLAGYTLCFQGLEPDPMLPFKVPYVLRKSSDLPAYLKFSVFSPPGNLKLAVPPDLSAAELKRDVDAVFQCLEKKLPAFGHARISATSPGLLRREGIRLKGKYILTREEVLSGARFSDAVARAAWPVEVWDTEQGQQLDYLPAETFYEIPLRCLQSINLKNVLAAGRCISAASGALASTRVMGTCIALGEAAGKAAAERCHE